MEKSELIRIDLKLDEGESAIALASAFARLNRYLGSGSAIVCPTIFDFVVCSYFACKVLHCSLIAMYSFNAAAITFIKARLSVDEVAAVDVVDSKDQNCKYPRSTEVKAVLG